MEKVWQRLRHGRYVEYNLVYDRGTKFGFAVPGVDIEVVLMSLPQNVMFEFRNNPAPGSKERKLLDVLTSPPRDWA
jgi:coproporphyrinogen III oxidase